MNTIAQRAESARVNRASRELFNILGVCFLTDFGEVRPIEGLAQDVLTKVWLMAPGRERDRIRRDLLGEVG